VSCLEQRRLLIVDGSGGGIHIAGTAGDDVITIDCGGDEDIITEGTRLDHFGDLFVSPDQSTDFDETEDVLGLG